ncbi:MAG: zinc ribbon domain-containing protein [Chloroflexi bacterium]|nr:MAG: zinc ribbon domain-containing protein [Chloroflexota bacterium]
MRCPNCGSPVHPAWTSCRGCGASLEALKAPAIAWAMPTPKPLFEGARRAFERAKSPTPQVDASKVHVPEMAIPAGAASAASRMTASTARLGWSAPQLRAWLVPVLLVAAVGAFALALVLAGAVGAARLDATRAHAAANESAQQLADVKAAMTSADQARVALQTSAQQAQQSATSQRDDLQKKLDDASKQITDVQAKLTTAESTANEQTKLAGLQKQQIKVLSDCLSGTQVAIEFGRSGRWNSADLALSTIAASCTAAKAAQ